MCVCVCVCVCVLHRPLLGLLFPSPWWLSVDDESVQCFCCQTSDLCHSLLCHSAGRSCCASMRDQSEKPQRDKTTATLCCHSTHPSPPQRRDVRMRRKCFIRSCLSLTRHFSQSLVRTLIGQDRTYHHFLLITARLQTRA